MEHQIFISYSSKDIEVALNVAEYFEKQGYTCFVANRDIQAGEQYHLVIPQKIEQAKALVLIFSQNSDNSAHVANELSMAMESSVPIFSLRIQNIKPNKLRYFCTTVQWVDSFSGLSKIDELAGAIGKMIQPLNSISDINRVIKTLEKFDIKVQHVSTVSSPSVKRLVFKIISKAKPSKVATFHSELMANLEINGDMRIIAPALGEDMFAIEIPAEDRRIVSLTSLLKSDEYAQSKGQLNFIVGQSFNDEIVVEDLSEISNLLVAGSTGSGKSEFLHSLICNLMSQYTPNALRFVLVDTRSVEFNPYSGCAHLLTRDIVTDSEKALDALDYLVSQVNTRFDLFKKTNEGDNSHSVVIHDLNTYNSVADKKLPHIVFICDEYFEIISQYRQAFEEKILFLAQRGKAVGIHIVLATQIPSVLTITGTIKSCFAYRIALKLCSNIDSRTVIDCGGAELLCGKGDMLFRTPTSNEPKRIQTPYVSLEEIGKYVTEANKLVNGQAIVHYDKLGNVDPLAKKALRLCLEKNKGCASIAFLQRNLFIGYNRSGYLLEFLQKSKLVEENSPDNYGLKPLKVLISLDELDDLFPDMEG